MKIIRSRIIKALLMAFIIGIILGVISYIISNKQEENSHIINYINLINTSKFNYLKGFINSYIYNIKYSFFIWLFGILFIFSFIDVFIIVFKGISLGYVLSSIFYIYKIKGALFAIILGLNNVLNILLLILLSYYSINFSIKSFNAWRNNRLINYRSFFINYIYIYIIALFIFLIISMFESYISSNIIKFVV